MVDFYMQIIHKYNLKFSYNQPIVESLKNKYNLRLFGLLLIKSNAPERVGESEEGVEFLKSISFYLINIINLYI
jgi:hypothetical protein